jgi:hypothetical protein
MATGTSRRGGVATDPPATFDLGNLRVVDPERELSRASGEEASNYRPLVEYALGSIPRKIENTVPVTTDDGELKLDEHGEPVREPVTYSKDEATKLKEGLRAAADAMRLPSRGQSLRIIVKPSLTDAKDTDRISVQWYVLNLKKSGESAQA